MSRWDGVGGWGGLSEGKTNARLGRGLFGLVWSVGTSGERREIPAIELHRLAEVYKLRTHNKMTTRQNDSGHPVTCMFGAGLMFWGMRGGGPASVIL